jgi:hypothetical protein
MFFALLRLTAQFKASEGHRAEQFPGGGSIFSMTRNETFTR